MGSTPVWSRTNKWMLSFFLFLTHLLDPMEGFLIKQLGILLFVRQGLRDEHIMSF